MTEAARSPMARGATEEAATRLAAAGLDRRAIGDWAAATPTEVGGFSPDCERFADFWAKSDALLAALPEKPARSDMAQHAADELLAASRNCRETFLGAHAGALYDLLTDSCSRFLRLADLVGAAARAIPGLCPSAERLAAEADRDQGDKDGIEIDHGILLANILALPRAGLHLCHAMLLPRPESAPLAAEFARTGVLDLGSVSVARRGDAVFVEAGNPAVLNAEDDTTLELMEQAVDVALLDPESAVLVMRGAPVDHRKYRGRRVFGSGINLTRLYRGKIPFLWFLQRDLGYVHKLMRGIATPQAVPDDVRGVACEKPWIAVVDEFAIGGHCQLLLVADHVVAAAGARMTLPARKEGIVPGFANLRLPRFTGVSVARQAIQHELSLPCDSREGRLICDEIAPPEKIDAAVAGAVRGFTEAGVVSAIANRRAFRVGQEPLDLFRRYASVYAREQAYCHFSSALIANLERHWNARDRKV